MTENELPFFTVIVPTFNRPRQLAFCLQALAGLDYPRDRMEVIVVDDGSPEAPTEIVKTVSDQIPVTLLRQANAGPAVARNTGAVQAQGKVLAFTDDDCAPDAQWLRALAAPFTTAIEPLLLGGRTVNSRPQDACAAASQTLIDYLYAYYNTRPGGARFFASNNIALSVEGFHALGGFNTAYRSAAGEDRDFCDRWLGQGLRMGYIPDARINHAHTMTLSAFWTQHFRYGQAAHRFHQRRSQHPLHIEPLSFYRDLICFPFRSTSPSYNRQQALEATFLLCLSQIANAAGFACEKAKKR